MHGLNLSSRRTVKIAVGAIVAAVVVRTVLARWPGLDPESLWYDDIVFAVIAWVPDLRTTLSLPVHAPPLFFLLLRAARAVFRDPEWSLQLLPFACGIAAIPVMGAVAWRMTGSPGLAVLAATLTALNPLLAHYSLFVKQYASDGLATAVLLGAGAAVLHGDRVDRLKFRRLAVAAGVLISLSITSVFTSAPVVALGAWRAWREPRDRRTVIKAASAYVLLLLASYLAFRSRTNEPLRDQAVFANRFLPLESFEAASGFLTRFGRRFLETSMPSWTDTELTRPSTVSWPLPLMALGELWLFSRRSTRTLGLAVAGFYAAALLASALHVYPLGAGRTDVYAFPVGITLFVMGVHGATQLLRGRELIRGAVALLVAAIALAAPIQARYFPVYDDRLVNYLGVVAAPDDAVILSPDATYLAAYYGPWSAVISPSSEHTSGTSVTILRPRTLHLPPEDRRPAPFIRAFLDAAPPARLWYVAFRTPAEQRALDAIKSQGYSLREMHETSRGRAYLGTRAGPEPAASGS
jgi:hypothetical protein